MPADAVSAGDLLAVLPGDRVPVDGVVVGGRSLVDESALTGEPLPLTKTQGEGAATKMQSLHQAAPNSPQLRVYLVNSDLNSRWDTSPAGPLACAKDLGQLLLEQGSELVDEEG